jgi:hypothetical protein
MLSSSCMGLVIHKHVWDWKRTYCIGDSAQNQLALKLHSLIIVDPCTIKLGPNLSLHTADRSMDNEYETTE